MASKLKFYTKRAKGKEYIYHKDGPGRRRLHGMPGTPAFEAEIRRAHEADRIALRKDNVASLCAEYRSDVRFKSTSATTQKQWRRWLNIIERDFGDLRVAAFEAHESKARIATWRSQWETTPRTADYAIQVLSRLLSFAIQKGKIQRHHCAGLDRLYKGDRSAIIWDESEIASLRAVAPMEIMWVADLACMTGLRRGDLLNLKWSDIADEKIRVLTSKSRFKTLVAIPLYPGLKALLAAIPRRGEYVLTNSRGKPWTDGGFAASWNKAKKKCTVFTKHFHDMRGTAATRFLNAGVSIADVAQLMGWSERNVRGIAARYISENARADVLASRLQRAMNPKPKRRRKVMRDTQEAAKSAPFNAAQKSR